MKREKILGVFLLLLYIFCFTSCSDDDPDPFTFYDTYYEVAVHGTRYITLKTGHPNYSAQVDDPRLAYVTLESGSSDPNGIIILHGILTGETTLTITDNERNENHVLKIRVVPNYECFHPFDSDSNHPALTDIYSIFFINNAERDLLFINKEAISLTDYKLVLVARGKYTFTKEGDEIYLTLTYAADSNGKLTDAAIAPTPHKFLITKYSEFLLHKFNQNLNLGWNTNPGTSSPGYLGYEGLRMKEVDTEYTIVGGVPGNSQIPEGILYN